MSFKRLVVVFSSMLLLAFASTALAVSPQDQLKVKINQVSPAIESLFEGGSALSQDTYSISSAIKVNYNLIAPSFPAAPTTFGTFTVGLAIDAATGSNTTYPVTVTIAQEGTGQNLQLAANSSTFSPTSASSTGSSTITMTIDCTVVGGCPTADGSTITANLQFSAPGSNHLNTSVKVQVNVTLVIPAAACVHLYNFLTDQTLIYPATSTQVVWVKNGVNAGKVTSTTPFGQFSDNVMIVNTCTADPTTKSFDLQITLDPSFETNPNDNPGNAVFTYLASQIVDPSTFNISNFAVQTAQGQALCLQNITLPTGDSFLATVHMGIQRGIQTLDLDTNNGDGAFNFVAKLFTAGSACGGSETASQDADLPFTLK